MLYTWVFLVIGAFGTEFDQRKSETFVKCFCVLSKKERGVFGDTIEDVDEDLTKDGLCTIP